MYNAEPKTKLGVCVGGSF